MVRTYFMTTTNEIETFEDLQVDFYHYMVEFGGLMPKTSKNYLAWLKFLSQNYSIDNNLTPEHIEYILTQEQSMRNERTVYTTKKDLTNFKSALREFLAFVKSDYHKRYEDSIMREVDIINANSHIEETEKESIIRSRIGQGIFRKELILYWKCCAVSGFDIVNLLVASHIKPWRNADNSERLDVFNGLLLTPNYDKLFDLGYITFDRRGTMVCSKMLPESERRMIGIVGSMRLIRIDERHKPYLKYHNERCFLG